MLSLACPYCGSEIEISEDMCDYQWGVVAARNKFECFNCSHELEIEVTGYIDDVTCLTVDNRISPQEAYEQYCEMKYDSAKEDGVLGD